MRDSRGRFTKGHKFNIGNKGNTRSKYGNKNACKYGYIQHTNAFMDESETFYYLRYKNDLIKLSKRYAIMDENSNLYIRSDVIKNHLKITDCTIHYVFKHEIKERLRDAKEIKIYKLLKESTNMAQLISET